MNWKHCSSGGGGGCGGGAGFSDAAIQCNQLDDMKVMLLQRSGREMEF